LLPLPREAGRADFLLRGGVELLRAPWRSVPKSSARAHGRLQRTLVRTVAPPPVRCRRWPSAVPRAQRNGRGSPAGSGCAGRHTAGGWLPPRPRLRRCPRASRWSGHQRPALPPGRASRRRRARLRQLSGTPAAVDAEMTCVSSASQRRSRSAKLSARTWWASNAAARRTSALARSMSSATCAAASLALSVSVA